jgi:hypothetical protein
MVPVRTLFMAAILGAAAVSAQAGDGRRLWTDPPPGVGPSVEPAAPEAWPDEAQRRLLPDRAASAPLEAAAFVATAPSTGTAAHAEPAGSGPVPRETAGIPRDGGPEAQPVPARPVPAPAVPDRTRRRLGVLAGFAGAAAPPEALSGRRAQQAQRALGRVRILQIRRGRVVLVYTRS